MERNTKLTESNDEEFKKRIEANKARRLALEQKSNETFKKVKFKDKSKFKPEFEVEDTYGDRTRVVGGKHDPIAERLNKKIGLKYPLFRKKKIEKKLNEDEDLV